MITPSLLSLLLPLAMAAVPKTVLVAIIDTGADITHQAIATHLWQNPGEMGTDKYGRDKATNGVDDDGNGFVDDIYGWNFADNNANLSDEMGHGTHISGIIGQSPSAKLMILKAMSPNKMGEVSLEASIRAIDYAIKMKAQIINYSAGGLMPSAREREALARAARQHILVVAAAGNEKDNADVHGFFPAAYHLENVLSVTAVDLVGRLLPSANFGSRTVGMAAPGQKILSALPGGQYGAMSGTSQATAMVTQAATLVCARSKRCPATELIGKLIKTGDHSIALEGKIRNPVVLNTMRMAQESL